MRLSRIVCLAVAAAVLAACASLAPPRAPRVLDDPPLVEWLQARVQMLSGGEPLDLIVIDGDALQADLDASGTLRIRRGLLLRLRDEAEVTFVLAHEIAHRDLDHFAQREREGAAWNALEAERAADRSALEVLGQMGLRSDAATSLLSVLDAELADAPGADPRAREVIAQRLEALWELAPRAHAPRSDDPWRRLMDSRWPAWFARDPAARDATRAALVRGHVMRPD